jgi:hypothetical protein
MDDLQRIWAKSDDIVEREIEGEILIIPLASGVGDLEDELFSVNETGREIWARIDGRRTVTQIVQELREQFAGEEELIRTDVRGFLSELIRRSFVVEVE